MEKSSFALQRTLNKVPEITLLFWITKVLTTGMGEVFSDFLFFRNLSPLIAVTLASIGLIVSLIVQFSVRRYVVWIYWCTVVMVSIFGTMVADFIHHVLGVPLTVSTAFFILVQALVFAIWYVMEKTLSIHSINTRRREAFYWATVLGTFALGTAVGDLTARTMHMGFLVSGYLFAVLIALPALAYCLFKLNETFAFWFAYIITRPLGASFSDWMAQRHSHGGLGLGTGPVSLVLTIIIVILVSYMAFTRKKVNEDTLA